jgi:hypothetical protein
LWFPPKRIPLEDGTTALLPVLVMVPAYSRYICGRMIPTRQTPDLLLGSWSLIEGFGRVPRRLIWDNEGWDRSAWVAASGTRAARLIYELLQLRRASNQSTEAFDGVQPGCLGRRLG